MSIELATGPPRVTYGSVKSSMVAPPCASIGSVDTKWSGSRLPAWKASSGSIPIRFHPTSSGSSHQGSRWGHFHEPSQPCPPDASSAESPHFRSHRNRKYGWPRYRIKGSGSYRNPAIKGRISTRIRHKSMCVFWVSAWKGYVKGILFFLKFRSHRSPRTAWGPIVSVCLWKLPPGNAPPDHSLSRLMDERDEDLVPPRHRYRHG